MKRRLLWSMFLLGLGGCASDEPAAPVGALRTLPMPDWAAIVFTSDAYEATPGAPREVYCIAADGTRPQRLTYSNYQDRYADYAEVAPASDRNRVAVRRILSDTNGDGRLNEADAAGLFFIRLDSSVEAPIVGPESRIVGIDWSPVEDLLLYGGNGLGDIEDFFVSDLKGLDRTNLTQSESNRERYPRFDVSGSTAVFETIPADGKSQVWVYRNTQVTSGGPGTGSLPGTRYGIGSDANPSYAPDNSYIVFRRLTGLGIGGRGTWDIMTVRPNGTSLATIVSGPAYRGAPAWGTAGIIFEEIAADGAPTRLVSVAPDGTGRKDLVTIGPGYRISSPRWLQPK
jgi:Tol biopolymer transport system component